MLGGQPNHGCDFEFLFNCTPAGRTSDSMMVQLKDLSIDERVGPDAASVIRPVEV